MISRSIPLINLNCNHCKLLKEGQCSVDDSKIKNPDKHYCFVIFKAYRKESKNEVPTNL